MTKQERATIESTAVKKTRLMEEHDKLAAIQVLYDMHISCDNISPYGYGFINGLALAVSILTNEPPKYMRHE
jgi:hypothetical protein